jgi:hypothetical protein
LPGTQLALPPRGELICFSFLKEFQEFQTPQQEKAASFSAGGKSHKSGHPERIEKRANQPTTAAWASAMPTPKKMTLPMIVPMILSPMVVMSVSPQFDD